VVQPDGGQHLGFDPQRDLGSKCATWCAHPAFVAYLAGDFSKPIEIDGPGLQAPAAAHLAADPPLRQGKRKLLLTRDVTALQLAEAMRRDFVANVSHEIRTPLTVLSGFVETMPACR
jgi:two-component system, OmpR family, phosphate regulon sensor histidine kinase PhoR